MTKQYISILDLLPTLISDSERGEENHRGFFPASNYNTSQYYYEVEESDSPSRKQLHFKSFGNLIFKKAQEIAERAGLSAYGGINDDKLIKKPFVIERKYQVPHIMELEFLKSSVYKDILQDEHFNYIENILYQYLLYFDRIDNFPENSNFESMSHYHTTGIDSEFYTNLSSHIVEIDDEDEDFESIIDKAIMSKYEKLSKTKKLTKKAISFMPYRMSACRNLDEILEIACLSRAHRHYRRTRVTVNDLSNSLPLLLLYSAIAQRTKESILPSYRDYADIFYNYPLPVKGQMRESYTLAEYIEDESAYNYFDGDEREDKPFIYSYGNNINVYSHRNNTSRGTNGIDYHDTRMVMFIFPHIMNQCRIAYFQDSDTMTVPQNLMREFRAEPWTHLVQAETILVQSNLDWGKEECLD